MNDPFDNPEAQAWAQRAIDELLPMIQGSAVAVSIVPDQAGVADIKFAVELGLSIMLDKPIILAVTPGRRIPEHLARVADELVEFDLTDRAATAARLRAAVAGVDAKYLAAFDLARHNTDRHGGAERLGAEQ